MRCLYFLFKLRGSNSIKIFQRKFSIEVPWGKNCNVTFKRVLRIEKDLTSMGDGFCLNCLGLACVHMTTSFKMKSRNAVEILRINFGYIFVIISKNYFNLDFVKLKALKSLSSFYAFPLQTKFFFTIFSMVFEIR